MIWLLNNWKIIGSALLAAGIFASGWVSGSGSVHRDWDREKLEQAQAHAAALGANQKIIGSLQETKNENFTEIDRLRANNHALWLRLSKTACDGTDTSSGSQDTTTGGGELHPPVPSSAEEALNGFDRTYSDEAYRADKIVEDCRVLSEWARKLE